MWSTRQSHYKRHECHEHLQFFTTRSPRSSCATAATARTPKRWWGLSCVIDVQHELVRLHQRTVMAKPDKLMLHVNKAQAASLLTHISCTLLPLQLPFHLLSTTPPPNFNSLPGSGRSSLRVPPQAQQSPSCRKRHRAGPCAGPSQCQRHAAGGHCSPSPTPGCCWW